MMTGEHARDVRSPLQAGRTHEDALGRIGWFEAYLSTWDIDRDNERFAQGAFADSILKWAVEGEMPALMWNHDRSDDPLNVIGRLLTMVEDAKGLRVTGQLNLANPRAVAVYEAMLNGDLRNMSVAFIGQQSHYEGDVRVFDLADILEATLTPVPSNTRAVILNVKSGRGIVAPPGVEGDLEKFLKTFIDTGGSNDPDTLERVTETFVANWTPNSEPTVDPEIERFKATLDALEGKAAPKLSELKPGDRAAADAAVAACLDAAEVADAACERFVVADLAGKVTLHRCSTDLRAIAQWLISTEGPNIIRRRPGTNALQAAEAMRLVAGILESRGEVEVADDLVRAANRVSATVNPLAGHQLDPPTPAERRQRAIDATNAVSSLSWEEQFAVEAEREADARARDLERIDARAREREANLRQAQEAAEAVRQSGFGDTYYAREA